MVIKNGALIRYDGAVRRTCIRFEIMPRILTMGEEKRASLNRLLADFPPGSLLPTRWLTSHGYADNLLPKYVAAGWLASAGRGVYC